jgi:hypothetical protein
LGSCSWSGSGCGCGDRSPGRDFFFVRLHGRLVLDLEGFSIWTWISTSRKAIGCDICGHRRRVAEAIWIESERLTVGDTCPNRDRTVQHLAISCRGHVGHQLLQTDLGRHHGLLAVVLWGRSHHRGGPSEAQVRFCDAAERWRR